MPDTCDLCGLPLGRLKVEELIGEKTLHFCCPGCRQVFLILSAERGSVPAGFKETELYRVCVESGIISNGPSNGPSNGQEGAVAPAIDPEADLPALDLRLRLEGMWCPACAWLIEEVLRRTPGVQEPHVSFFSDGVEMKYLPHVISPVEITSRVARLGYRASQLSEDRSDASGRHDLLTRLGVSAILSANVMMVSCALYFGFFRDLSSAVIAYFSYPLLALATPVVFYGGFPILWKAASGLKYGKTSMDTLIAMSVLAAYFYSVIQMARGSMQLYFDTACMLVTLVLAGKFIEAWARQRVSAGIAELHSLAYQKVRLEKESREEWVSVDEVKPGDRFVVRSKERVPVDGRIEQGRGLIDESILTGESRPLHKGSGEDVMAGSFLKDGELVLTATRAGSESSLRQMVSLVMDALDRKVPVELLADRITAYFVPAVLLIAAVAALFLSVRHVPADEVLLRSLTVLLISCPCALGIATPLVKVAMLGIGRSKGLLVRDPGALERAKDIDVLIFDKTGTVTEGNFSLQKVVTRGFSEEDVLSRLAALELGSSHFLAREIVLRARQSGIDICEAERVEEVQGRGVKGIVRNDKVVIGNRSFIAEHEMALRAMFDDAATKWQRQGMTVLFFGWEREVKGILVFGDPVKKGVAELVDRLRDLGVAVWLVSGDAKETTAAVAASVGIGEYRGQMLPVEKAHLVVSLQRAGHKVGMIGDGLNDAAALAQADVALACGVRADLIRETSDIAILTGDPGRVLDVLDLSQLTTRAIRQNLLFAFLYNVTAIPLAVTGMLNPLIAVTAMFGSSFTVIGNALRITWMKQPRRLADQRREVAEAAVGEIA
ncbi:MAG TPA: heavy metal translocating P-type ATPase [Syntrophorhabdales bacterium]|nr:heavy metal translocating P-type ATPase [Syntrophorhabdales bacterium]